MKKGGLEVEEDINSSALLKLKDKYLHTFPVTAG
jgi:hypothetical protein